MLFSTVGQMARDLSIDGRVEVDLLGLARCNGTH